MGKHWLPWEREGLGLQVLDFPTDFLLEGTSGWYYHGSAICSYTDGYAAFLLGTTVGRESSVISPATTTLSGISWVHYHAPPRAAHAYWWPVLPCCLVAKSCLTLCNPLNCSMPGFPVLRYLPEFAQTHVCWVGDAIQPSHPLLSPSPALSLFQHHGLFR